MILSLTKTKRFFSKLNDAIPKVNLRDFLVNKNHSKQCEDIGKILSQYGCVIVEDPRISEEKNINFLAMMKQYFMRRQEEIDRGLFVDVYKEFDYEVGLSPPNIIQLYDEGQKVRKFRLEHKPLTPFPPQPMRTMRYLWNIGEVNDEEIPQNRPPTDFPEFEAIMNDWGDSTLNTVVTISEMLEFAFGLKKGTFSQKLIGGPNKLAPLGFDLKRCRPGEAFAGIHDDFGFLTVHGRSTFPGLFVWLPSGQKIKVRTPPGCLFLQAGTQLQHMTGGYIQSGMHEAINTEQVQNMAKKQIDEGKNPWRITSTVFTHVCSNVIMKPEGRFQSGEANAKFPPTRQHQHMMKFLKQRQVK